MQLNRIAEDLRYAIKQLFQGPHLEHDTDLIEAFCLIVTDKLMADKTAASDFMTAISPIAEALNSPAGNTYIAQADASEAAPSRDGIVRAILDNHAQEVSALKEEIPINETGLLSPNALFEHCLTYPEAAQEPSKSTGKTV